MTCQNSIAATFLPFPSKEPQTLAPLFPRHGKRLFSPYFTSKTLTSYLYYDVTIPVADPWVLSVRLSLSRFF